MSILHYYHHYYLYSRLVEFGDSGELVAHVDVGVVALGEGRLELLQLLLCESGSVSASRRRRTSGRRVMVLAGAGSRQHYR